MRLIYLNGKSDYIPGWARKNGVKPATAFSRISRGWEVQRAISEPTNQQFSMTDKIVTKNTAELELNEIPREKFPVKLSPLIQNFNGTKAGRYVRTHHRKEFDEWFSDHYLRDYKRLGRSPLL